MSVAAFLFTLAAPPAMGANLVLRQYCLTTLLVYDLLSLNYPEEYFGLFMLFYCSALLYFGNSKASHAQTHIAKKQKSKQ